MYQEPLGYRPKGKCSFIGLPSDTIQSKNVHALVAHILSHTAKAYVTYCTSILNLLHPERYFLRLLRIMNYRSKAHCKVYVKAFAHQ